MSIVPRVLQVLVVSIGVVSCTSTVRKISQLVYIFPSAFSFVKVLLSFFYLIPAPYGNLDNKFIVIKDPFISLVRKLYESLSIKLSEIACPVLGLQTFVLHIFVLIYMSRLLAIWNLSQRMYQLCLEMGNKNNWAYINMPAFHGRMHEFLLLSNPNC